MEGDTTQHIHKITVRVTVHDLTTKRWLRGVRGRHLRLKYLEICHQFSNNGWILGGAIKFEFKISYKLCVAIQHRKLFILIFFALCYLSLMNHMFFKDLFASSVFGNLPEDTQQFICSTMLGPRETASTKGTVSSEGDALEVVIVEAQAPMPMMPSSPRSKPTPMHKTRKPKKDNQKRLVPVVSCLESTLLPRHRRRTKNLRRF